tara:strand:- start:28891 stop:30351 length:1461 start_codon:yes stop_codon:yes gene_type:complete
MSNSVSPNTTGASLAAQATPAELWQKEFDIYEQANDFWKPMEGTTNKSLIRVKTDLTKGAGSTLNIRNLSGLYGAAQHGDDRFDTAAKFDTLKVNDYQLTIDVLRNAISLTERAEEWMGVRYQLENGMPGMLGEWLGREKSHKLFMMFKHKGTAANTIYANGKANRDALVAADTLDMELITGMGTRLSRLNGRPARIGIDDMGNAIDKYCVIATKDALRSLKADNDYKLLARDGSERGINNPLRKGGYIELDGQVIKEYNPVDHDGEGPIGCPIGARAELGAAVTAGTTTFDILGGGTAEAGAVTTREYFRDFPDFNYKFRSTDTIGVGSADFYVAIVNLEGADAGKFGFYQCDANDGNKLTVSQRMSATDGTGIRLDAVGGLTFSAAVNTEAHPVGSPIIFTNSTGVPIGQTLMLGANAGIRGYGKHRSKTGPESDEDGFIKEFYVRGYIGQTPRTDRRGRSPGFIVMEHAVSYEGIPLSPNLTP